MLQITKFLRKLLVLESQVTDLGQVSLAGSVELFLEELETGLGLALLVAGLVILVQGLNHLLVLALRLL